MLTFDHFKIMEMPITYFFHSANKNIQLLNCSALIVLTNVVRMAERSKAPDLSSGTHMCAWVRTPLLTMLFFTGGNFFNTCLSEHCVLKIMKILRANAAKISLEPDLNQ